MTFLDRLQVVATWSVSPTMSPTIRGPYHILTAISNCTYKSSLETEPFATVCCVAHLICSSKDGSFWKNIKKLIPSKASYTNQRKLSQAT